MLTSALSHMINFPPDMEMTQKRQVMCNTKIRKTLGGKKYPTPTPDRNYSFNFRGERCTLISVFITFRGSLFTRMVTNFPRKSWILIFMDFGNGIFKKNSRSQIFANFANYLFSKNFAVTIFREFSRFFQNREIK